MLSAEGLRLPAPSPRPPRALPAPSPRPRALPHIGASLHRCTSGTFGTSAPVRLLAVTFLLFATVAALSWLFVLRRVPETRGRSLEEMEAYFEQACAVYMLQYVHCVCMLHVVFAACALPHRVCDRPHPTPPPTLSASALAHLYAAPPPFSHRRVLCAARRRAIPAHPSSQRARRGQHQQPWASELTASRRPYIARYVSACPPKLYQQRA